MKQAGMMIRRHTSRPNAGWMKALAVISPSTPQLHHLEGGIYDAKRREGDEDINGMAGKPHHRKDGEAAGM